MLPRLETYNLWRRESPKNSSRKPPQSGISEDWNFIRKTERCDEGQVSSIVNCLYKHRQSGALVTLGRSPVIFYQLILTLFWKPSETPSMTKRDIDLKKSFKTVKWITPLDEDECTIRWCWWKREKCERAGDTLKRGSHCFVLKRTLSPGRNQENAFSRDSCESVKAICCWSINFHMQHWRNFSNSLQIDITTALSDGGMSWFLNNAFCAA